MRQRLALALTVALALACKEKEATTTRTTAGAIAVQNLEHQIAQAEKQGPMMHGQLIELLLMKSHFLGKHVALDRAVEIAEEATTADGLMLRARARSALHRFAEALADLEAAEKLGADAREVAERRAAISVAIGRPEDAIGPPKSGYAALTALATAYAAAGRFDDAEQAYLEAIRELRSTSPFPFAWVHFSRGVMWSERAGDPKRGALCYAQALEHLPQYAVANVHLAELEAERGDVKSAIDRLKRIDADDPEPLALLGELLRNEEMIGRAKARYEELLSKHRLAFADHAAEFYLTRDAARAWELAKTNVDNRENERSLALAIRAARAAGKNEEACALVVVAKAKKHTGVELSGLLDGC